MSVFNGLTGVLAATLGAPVTFLPAVGAPVVVQSIFRETPIEVLGDDQRPMLITAATWRVRRDLVQATRGDQIQLADGRLFRVSNKVISGSPADDAFMIYEMEAVA